MAVMCGSKDKCTLVTDLITRDASSSSKKILLGEWCLTDGEIACDNHVERLVPYVDSSDNLKLDHARSYKEVFPIFTCALNKTLGWSLNDKSWSFLIGPWLIKCIFLVTERYHTLQNGLRDKDVTAFECIKVSNLNTIVAWDLDELTDFAKMDQWNSVIFGEIYEEMARKGMSLPVCKASEKKYHTNKEINPNTEGRKLKKLQKAKSFILNKLLRVNVNSQNQTVLFLDSYLPKSTLLFLNVRFNRQIALHATLDSWSNEIRRQVEPNFELRETLRKTVDELVEEELSNNTKMILALIHIFVPTCNLEGARKISELVLGGNIFSDRIKVVVTGTAQYKNELLKMYLALNHQNLKVIIRQHGGEYFTGSFVPYEELDTEVADVYLTGGSVTNGAANCHFVNFGNPYERQRFSGASGDAITIVLRPVTKWPTSLQSNIHKQSGEFSRYIGGIIDLYSGIPEELKEKVIFRPGMKESEPGYRCISKIIEHKIPGVKIATSGSLADVVESSRLVIVNYFGTAALELLDVNIPVLFNHMSGFEFLRPDFECVFSSLRDAGLIIDDGRIAKDEFSRIYKDPDAWKRQRKVVRALSLYAERYSRKQHNYFKSISDLIVRDKRFVNVDV